MRFRARNKYEYEYLEGAAGVVTAKDSMDGIKVQFDEQPQEILKRWGVDADDDDCARELLKVFENGSTTFEPRFLEKMSWEKGNYEASQTRRANANAKSSGDNGDNQIGSLGSIAKIVGAGALTAVGIGLTYLGMTSDSKSDNDESGSPTSGLSFGTKSMVGGAAASGLAAVWYCWGSIKSVLSLESSNRDSDDSMEESKKSKTVSRSTRTKRARITSQSTCRNSEGSYYLPWILITVVVLIIFYAVAIKFANKGKRKCKLVKVPPRDSSGLCQAELEPEGEDLV